MAASSWFPGSEIPHWFSYKGEGSSLSFRLPPTLLTKLQDPVIVCVVHGSNMKENTYPRFITLDINVRAGKENLCYWGVTYSRIPLIPEDHVWVYHIDDLGVHDIMDGKDIEVEVTTLSRGGVNVKRLGVHFGRHIYLGDCSSGLSTMEVGASSQVCLTDLDESRNHQAEANPWRRIDSSDENRPRKRMRTKPTATAEET